MDWYVVWSLDYVIAIAFIMVEACKSTLMGCFREQIKIKQSLKTYCLTDSSYPCNIILHVFLCCLYFFLWKPEVMYICVQKGNPTGKTLV